MKRQFCGVVALLLCVRVAAADLPVTNGVALWLDASSITNLTNGAVMAVWPDQSPLGRDLGQADTNRQPTYVTNGINGRAAVTFDGTADRLFRAGMNQPVREIFAVADAVVNTGWRNLVSNGADGHSIRVYQQVYRDVQDVEVPYGGYFRQNGVYDTSLLVGRPHIVHAASPAVRTYDTFMVGDNGRHNRYWSGPIAEVIVYDRELSDLERGQIGLHLEAKYGIDAAYGSLGSVSVAGIGSTHATLSGSLYSSHGMQTDVMLMVGTMDGGTNLAAWGQTNLVGRVSISTTFSTNLNGLAEDTVYYCRLYATNAAEVAWSPQIAAFRTRSGVLGDASLWLSADSNDGLTNGAVVRRWVDGSGNQLHAESQAVSNDVVHVSDGFNGMPVVRFNGSNDCYFAFPTMTDIRTVFWVAKEDADATATRFLLGYVGAEIYDFHRGIDTKRIWQENGNSRVSWAGVTRLNGSRVNGPKTDVPTDMSIISLVTVGDARANTLVSDRGIAGRTWDGDIAELLVFNRALTPAELSRVGLYLSDKYDIASTYNRLETLPATDVTKTTATLNGSLNDTAGQATTVTVYWGPSDGGTNAGLWAHNQALALTSEPAAFTLPVSGLDAARTYYCRFAGSNSVESFWAPLSGAFRTSFSATDGLMVWLDASAETGLTNGSAVSVFRDWSGNENHSVQIDTNAQPTFVTNVLNGMPVMHFDGVNDYMDGEQWLTAKTIIAVNRVEAGAPTLSGLFSRRASDSQNIRSQGTGWNSHATAINTADFPFTGRAFINGTAGYVHGNAYHVLEEMSAGSPYFPYRLSQPMVLNNNHRNFKGDLAEMMIYNRALTIDERNEIGTYLETKYGIDFTRTVPDVPVEDGLELWYAADMAVGYLDNQIVYQWEDLSGNGRHGANAGGTTVLVPGTTNEQPVVRFDGTNDSYYSWSRLDSIRSVFWVISEDGDAAASQRFLLGSQGLGQVYHFHRNGTFMWHGTHTHVNIRDGVTRLDGVVVDGLSTTVPTNGLSVVSVVTTGNVTANAFSGDRGIAGRTWDGDLAELLIYSRALSDEEEYAVGVYLTKKYGLETEYAAEKPGMLLIVK